MTSQPLPRPAWDGRNRDSRFVIDIRQQIFALDALGRSGMGQEPW